MNVFLKERSTSGLSITPALLVHFSLHVFEVCNSNGERKCVHVTSAGTE